MPVPMSTHNATDRSATPYRDPGRIKSTHAPTKTINTKKHKRKKTPGPPVAGLARGLRAGAFEGGAHRAALRLGVWGRAQGKGCGVV